MATTTRTTKVLTNATSAGLEALIDTELLNQGAQLIGSARLILDSTDTQLWIATIFITEKDA